VCAAMPNLVFNRTRVLRPFVGGLGKGRLTRSLDLHVPQPVKGAITGFVRSLQKPRCERRAADLECWSVLFNTKE
jgi:hypothetical protein